MMAMAMAMAMAIVKKMECSRAGVAALKLQLAVMAKNSKNGVGGAKMGRKYTNSSCKTNKSWGQLELQLQASLALFLLFFSETRFSSCCFECHKVHIKRQKKNPADVADLVYLHSFRTPPPDSLAFYFSIPHLWHFERLFCSSSCAFMGFRKWLRGI